VTAEPVDERASRPRATRALPVVVREHQGRRAGIVTRLLANAVDFAIVTGFLIGTWFTWAALRFLRSPTGFTWPAPSWWIVVVAFEVVAFVYFTVSWATTGRTYGAVLLGLRVVNFRGRRMRWSGAALRAAFCVLFWVGLFWVVVSRSNRSVQDVVLRTSVVYDWDIAAPAEQDVTEPPP